MKRIAIVIAALAVTAALAYAGSKCIRCNGTGWDGSFKCVPCGGDGEF